MFLSCRDVRDSYLPAFHACAGEARAASVMCSYNAVNGTPACASSWLLREQLRGGMQFGCAVPGAAGTQQWEMSRLPQPCCWHVQGVCGERLWGHQQHH